MPSKHVVWIATLTSLFIALTARAQDNACKHTDDCIYGSAVADRWILGSRAQKKGDFDAALAEYRQALAAAGTVTATGMSDKQVRDLRECAAAGSEARIAAAGAGRQYLALRGRNPQTILGAQEAANKAFQAAIARKDAERPDLATSCP